MNKFCSMLKVDLKRLFTTKLLYIMLFGAILCPVLIIVMTSMMDGSVTVDPNTGVETVIEGFENTWQVIATPSGESTASMDMTSMVNINLLYFAIGVVCAIFIGADFKSGYYKTLFTRRTNKTNYIVSKTITVSIIGIMMIIGWLLGTIVGGSISGLSFELGNAGVMGLTMCVLTKCMLMLLFTPLYVMFSVIAKDKMWLSIILSLVCGMFLFTIVPTVSPLDSSIMNVFVSLVAGIIGTVVLSIISKNIMNKRDIA